jgi:protein O-mannosyl-transferase
LLFCCWITGRCVVSRKVPHEVGGEPVVAPALWTCSLFLETDLGEGALVCSVGCERAHHHEDGRGGVQLYGGRRRLTRAKFPLWIRLATAAIAYVKYVGKAFWPVNLALVYPHPGFAISIPAAVLSVLAIVAVSTLVVIFRQRAFLFVGWFWFLGTLVPMTGLVPIGVQAMADRYAYIPLLGIFVIVCWGAADLIERWHIPTAVAAAGTASILLTLGIALHRQVSFWSDNVTLWTHTLQITDANFTAEDNLATALITEGRVEEALPHLLRARWLRPDDPLSTLNIATYLHDAREVSGGSRWLCDSC